MRTPWDAGQYLRFSDHRSRPAFELFKRFDHDHPAYAVDLGCGTGDMARAMKDRWPPARVVGLDQSTEMLATAEQAGGKVEWVEADIADWRPAAPIDVLYSNAALQWLPDHHLLFPRLVSYLAPGGVLAVQMPLSWSEPSHVLMRETLESGGPDGTPLGPQHLRVRLAHKWVAEPVEYYDLLTPLVGTLDFWTTRYFQVLEGSEPVYEWVKGTGLKPVLETLTRSDLDQFLSHYRERLATAYPRRADGTTLYPFPRLFIVATTVP